MARSQQKDRLADALAAVDEALRFLDLYPDSVTERDGTEAPTTFRHLYDFSYGVDPMLLNGLDDALEACWRLCGDLPCSKGLERAVIANRSAGDTGTVGEARAALGRCRLVILQELGMAWLDEATYRAPRGPRAK